MYIRKCKDKEITLLDFDPNKFYNVKDIKILVPSEIIIEDASENCVYLDSEKFLLNFEREVSDPYVEKSFNIYSIVLGNELFGGGEKISLTIYINGVPSDTVFINFNSFTPFTTIYNLFFEKITDDMYMELTREDTYRLVKGLLVQALQHFEFPRVNIYDFDENKEVYNVELSLEEMDIIATYMVMHWLGQQLASVENTRMKYSGSDFKFTSQANHMAKLQNLKKDYERLGFHLQRLYKRRKADKKGIMRSTFGSIMEASFKK